jgi:hypothetical protein
MLRMLTLHRMGPFGEIKGSSVGKGGESNIESQHLQGGSCDTPSVTIVATLYE